MATSRGYVQRPDAPIEPVPARARSRIATRQRILEAAQPLFEQRGYPGTSTRELAAAAGVTERTLFRHFPSKARLFQEAVITPFHDFVEEAVKHWEDRPKGLRDAFSEALEFNTGLYDVLMQNRNLVLALVSVRAFDDPAANQFPELNSALAELLTRLQHVLEVEADKRDFRLDPYVTVRLTFGMVLSAAIHADWLFPEGGLPERSRVLAELAALTVYGLYRPTDYRPDIGGSRAQVAKGKRRRRARRGAVGPA